MQAFAPENVSLLPKNIAFVSNDSERYWILVLNWSVR